MQKNLRNEIDQQKVPAADQLCLIYVKIKMNAISLVVTLYSNLKFKLKGIN